MTGFSEKALEAGMKALPTDTERQEAAARAVAADVLKRASTPALGLERSVRLGDVVEAEYELRAKFAQAMADGAKRRWMGKEHRYTAEWFEEEAEDAFAAFRDFIVARFASPDGGEGR